MHGKLVRVRLAINNEQLKESEENLAWFLRDNESLRSKISRHIGKTIPIMLCIILLAFFLPVLIPATTQETWRWIIQAVGEIGLIISLFMACKYSFTGLVCAAISTAFIISYFDF